MVSVFFKAFSGLRELLCLRFPIQVTVLFVLLTFSSSFAGLDYLTDKTQILERAKTETEAWMAPEGPLQEWNKKKGLKGTYSYDISFRNKGQVLTVFIHPKQAANPRELAMLKDQLMAMRYHFKTPKGQVYKFSHSFTF